MSWMKSRVESLWMKHFGAGDVEESQGLVLRDELADRRYDSPADLPSDEDGGSLERPKITTWEAGWNVTNAIQVSAHSCITHVLSGRKHAVIVRRENVDSAK